MGKTKRNESRTTTDEFKIAKCKKEGESMSDIQWSEAMLEGKTSDGVYVRFKCRHWAKDVNVEMIEPHSGETASIHMPYMSPATYLENNRWQDAAWGLVRGILERMAWKESHVREVDRPDLCTVHALDVAKFAEYLHQLDDAQGHVLDAWIEIDGSDSEWCATLTR